MQVILFSFIALSCCLFYIVGMPLIEKAYPEHAYWITPAGKIGSVLAGFSIITYLLNFY